MKKTLIYSAVVASLLIGCGSEKKEETKAPVTTEQTQKQESKHDIVRKVEENTKISVEKAKEVVAPVVEKAKEAVKPAVEKTKEVATKAVEKVKEEAAPVVEKAKEVTSQAVEKVKEAVAPSVDGKTLFVACSGCHGAKGEKKALGMSKVIGGWEASKVEEALKGYKAGTYGGAMKGVMQGQAAKLDDAKIKALAGYISTLK